MWSCYSEGRIPGQETVVGRQECMLLHIHAGLVFSDRYIKFLVILKLQETCGITGRLVCTIDIIPLSARYFFDPDNELYIFLLIQLDAPVIDIGDLDLFMIKEAFKADSLTRFQW